MNYKIVNGSVSYGAETILEEINFEIKEKDKIAIVGVLVDSLKHVENVENIVAENITFDEQNADALKELDRFLKNK